METIVISVKTQKDRNLFTSLADRLHLKSKVLTEEDKEDYGLLKAMLESKKDDFVDRETIMEAFTEMKTLFEKKFLKDIKGLSDKELKHNIEIIIIEIENAVTLSRITNLKKLKGHKAAYRIRIGEYRLAFFFEKQTVKLTRFLHRKDIYKYFP